MSGKTYTYFQNITKWNVHNITRVTDTFYGLFKYFYTLNEISQVWDDLLATENHLKMMKNALYFALKSFFFPKILKYLS